MAKRKKSTPPRSEPVVLAPALTIAGVAGLKCVFESRLEKDEAVLIDCSAVEVADTAGMQLLIAFVRAARSRALTVTMGGVTTAMSDTAELLGLTAWLNTSLSAEIAA
jgi:ABC-type transporter Mla MlaB component